ncbi:MAG: TIGR04282 family arsenosugar biosynthesis glycosyltransferase [Thermodesulfobacteriota bacterium]
MLPVLIIFSRYPEAGRSKTRLIPALGASGAARLHEDMTRHTLRTAAELAQGYPVRVEVHYAGGDEGLMRQVFGGDFPYLPQAAGDLGQKMRTALEGPLTTGTDRAAVIGTDCPDLTASRLQQALEALKTRELVLGPAPDGGYYLIGCRRAWPQLFADMPWGTEQVWARTLAAAQGLELNPYVLEPLPDVDRPEDLSIWEAVRRGHGRQRD